MSDHNKIAKGKRLVPFALPKTLIDRVDKIYKKLDKFSTRTGFVKEAIVEKCEREEGATKDGRR